MWLLSVHTRELRNFPRNPQDEIPAIDYAILSHTWDHDECSFQDFHPTVSPKAFGRHGYGKIDFCCRQALKDGFDWVWVDTCCIDKTSTAELTESINSMFQWYQRATRCYAYLSTVNDRAGLIQELNAHEPDKTKLRWFYRGWTLQELIAPRGIWFYTSNGSLLGTRKSLKAGISHVTGVDTSILVGVKSFRSTCVAKRMRWAAGRQTERPEDSAYSLIGLFDVNMPLIYGEGAVKSFIRLQQEIMRGSDDQTLFAWGLPLELQTPQQFSRDARFEEDSLRGLLAQSAEDFSTKYEIMALRSPRASSATATSSNGVKLELPICKIGGVEFAIISCTVNKDLMNFLGVPLRRWHPVYARRHADLVVVSAEDWIVSQMQSLEIKEKCHFLPSSPPAVLNMVRVPKSGTSAEMAYRDHYILEEVLCLPHAQHLTNRHAILFPEEQRGIHAALFFSPILDSEMSTPEQHKVVFPFAIVIGSNRKGLRAALVLISDNDRPGDSAHPQGIGSRVLDKLCMTKHQLLQDIYSDGSEKGILRGMMSHIHLPLTQWKVQAPDECLEPHNTQSPDDVWELLLCVNFWKSRGNLADNTTIVYIAIETSPAGQLKAHDKTSHNYDASQDISKLQDLPWFLVK